MQIYICMTCIQSNGNVLKCKWGDHLAVVDESYIIRVNKEDSDQRRAHYSS